MRTLTILTLSLLVACSTSAPPAPEAPPEPATNDETAKTDDAEGEGMEAGAEGDAAGGEADAEADPAMALPSAAKLDEAKGLARAMMPKKALLEAVNPVLGEPSAMTDTEAHWMAKAEDGCKMLKVSLMGDMVGSATVEDADCPAGDGGEN